MKRYIFACAASLLALSAQAQFAVQKVVLEEFTGAWCQYCPDGSVIAEQVDNNYANAIVYAVHNGDDMEVTEGTDLGNFYVPSYPQAVINRSGALVSRNQWSSTVGTAQQGASVVAVSFDSIAYNDVTRQLTVHVKALFSGPASGDMRFNLVLFEDHITGTGPGYNQVNAFNNTPGHTYYQAGNPIVGFDHRHVMRTMLSGTWGEAGIIPTTANYGTTATKVYTYTLPANWKAWDVGLAAIVQRYDGSALPDRKILNGEEFHMNTLVVSNQSNLDHSMPLMEIAPNPSAGQTKISFTLQAAGQIRMEVLNTLGQHVSTLGEGIMNEGIHTLVWNGRDSQGNSVENGIYLVRLLTENGQSATKRVMIAR